MPPSRQALQTGFTLIEVLLVVLLIGVVSGLVLLAASPSDPSRMVVGEADRLEEALSLAQDTAVSDNEQYGLVRTEEGYAFLIYDDASRQWLPSPAGPFSAYRLPPEIQMAVTPVEAAGRKDRKENAPLQGKGGKDAVRPEVMLLSSGESTPAEISLSAEGVTPERLRLDDIGNLTRNPDSRGATP